MRSLRGEGKTCSIVGPDIHSPSEEVDVGVRLSQCEVEGYLILPVVCGAAESRSPR